jgi:hypothetical protein
MNFPVRKRLALAALCLSAACCAGGGEYAQYRAEHPEWDGSFPREGNSLEEVLAALHAPATADGVRTELTRLEVWRVDGDSSKRVDADAVRRGEAELAPAADVFVLARRTCRAERGLEDVETERIGSYLLPGRKLAAFDHYDFGKVCAVTDQFRAARGDATLLERAASMRMAAAFGRVPVDLAQLYQRGLAYLEAGRVEDAQAALMRGEVGFRDLEQRVAAGQLPPRALQEAARQRARLMRALGVEARDLTAPAPR